VHGTRDDAENIVKGAERCMPLRSRSRGKNPRVEFFAIFSTIDFLIRTDDVVTY